MATLTPVVAAPAGGRRSRFGWRALGGAFTALTLTATILTAWSWLGRRSEHDHEVLRHAVSRIEVTIDGSATFAAGPAGQVSVDRAVAWSYPRPAIEERWDGDVLHLGVVCPSHFRLPGCGATYVLRVPAGVAVDAVTRGGDLTVHDLSGDLTLSARGGDVTAAGLRSSTVRATGDSGRLSLGFAVAPAAVRATTSSGDAVITLPGSDPYAVDAGTAAGRTTVDVRRDPSAPRSIVAHSQSGNVQISYAD
jgi:hypothetical protein